MILGGAMRKMIHSQNIQQARTMSKFSLIVSYITKQLTKSMVMNKNTTTYVLLNLDSCSMTTFHISTWFIPHEFSCSSLQCWTMIVLIQVLLGHLHK